MSMVKVFETLSATKSVKDSFYHVKMATAHNEVRSMIQKKLSHILKYGAKSGGADYGALKTLHDYHHKQFMKHSNKITDRKALFT